MDPNPTPWRVLEDPIEAVPAATGDAARAATSATRRSVVVIAVATVALAVGAFLLAAGTSSGGSVVVEGGSAFPGEPSRVAGPSGSAIGVSGGVLVVEIVGAVEHAGVYRLPVGSRIGDLVAAAGGYGARVDTDRAARDLNMAATLRDGDQVRVPSRDDDPSVARGSGPAGTHGPASGAVIRLNTATAEQLDTLPGVGPATAAKILASRDEQPFATVDELRSRKLVGEKTFAGLKDLVTVQ